MAMMFSNVAERARELKHAPSRTARIVGLFLIAAVLIWLWGGASTVLRFRSSHLAGVLDIAVLVFREGLECILVLAAITASMRGSGQKYRRSVALGAGIGFLATLITWQVTVRILDDLSENVSALALQAATGLLAILVLLLVMNWFFHGVYWTGWIALHNQRKRELLQSERDEDRRFRLLWGMALLGFTSFYREGFEVVLFLQSYRLKLGSSALLLGVLLGICFSGIVAILTFVAHGRLPYRRMLVSTGVMLAFVLLVMVGEETQEMQLAGWLPTTEIPRLAHAIPSWMGLWLSVFPTVETLSAQALAAIVVFGSYFTAQRSFRFKQQTLGTRQIVSDECPLASREP